MTSKRIYKIIYLIKTDLYRHSGKISLKDFLKCYILIPGFNFMFWHRIASTYKFSLFNIILYYKTIKYGIQIPRMDIGEGFYIGHFGEIVINGRAKIGKNCNISQGVTIGVANTGPNKGVPTIGNFVYIAPGAKIMGKINIGNNVAIGANSVVAKDVPDDSVVVGVPARVVSKEGSKGYINKILNE